MSDLAAQLRDVISGSYAIDREIGRGGMATVYLARDVRHNRHVALKVLDPELGAVLGVERFLSEIQVTANLQHPNLLPLFDSGQANGLLYYVMPYVQGESLRAKLEREKQLPIDEAIHIATAVASALDYAHRHGVIHRDLKPENILLHDGQPLVADFGIALAVSRAGGHRITQTGLSLGTPQYMSPEQATGDRVVDARSDVYSLGAVTYEMLTGEAPHTGNTAQAIIAKVITDRPRSIRLSRDTVPPHVERAVDCALAKLPADRFHTAHEFADALLGRQVAIPAGVATPGSFDGGASLASTRSARRMIAALAGALVVTAAIAGWALLSERRRTAGDAVRFSLPLHAGERIGGPIGHAFAISSDGRLVAYAASRPGKPGLLYVRAVHDLFVRELAGTDGADQPAFSPDGKWIAFITGGSLKKVLVDGSGAPITLANLGSARGVAWAPSGQIVLGGNNTPLVLVPEGGGAPRRLTTVGVGDQDHRWPTVLDDGKTIVFSIYKGSLPAMELGATSIDGGPIHRLSSGVYALGLVDGQLAYVNATGTLMTMKYDASGPRLTGSASPNVSDVFVNIASGAAFAALSRSGNLVYEVGSQRSQLVLSDMRGQDRVMVADWQSYSFPRFSPDGQRIAVTITSGSGLDVWIYDRKAGTIAKLTTSGQSERPEWSPDGKRVLYRSNPSVMWQPADRSAPEEALATVPGANLQEGLLSPKGVYLLMRVNGQGFFQDIVYRRIGDTTLTPLIKTSFAEYGARFSPDGRWVAYSSDESGLQQVYVTPFPGPGPHYQLSVDGGVEPVWAPDGRRLYYVRGRTMISVAVTLTSGFSVTSRDSLFTGSYFFPINHANYDIAPNGKEMLLLRGMEVDAQPVFVFNWKGELRRGLAAKR